MNLVILHYDDADVESFSTLDELTEFCDTAEILYSYTPNANTIIFDNPHYWYSPQNTEEIL